MKKLIVIIGSAVLIAGCASHRNSENTGGMGNGTDTDTGTTTNSSYHFDAIPQAGGAGGNGAGGIGGSLGGANSGSLNTNSDSGVVTNNSGTGTPH